jgi:hypothetical protein
VRRDAFAAKPILFQTSPLAPGGEGTAGPAAERPARTEAPRAPAAAAPSALRAGEVPSPASGLGGREPERGKKAGAERGTAGPLQHRAADSARPA